MYLHIVQHKGNEPSIVAAQLIAWMFESHCWLENPPATTKKCVWCGAESQKDMKMVGFPEPIMCQNNPLISGADLRSVLEQLSESTAATPRRLKGLVEDPDA
jgi:hypothetical protein